MSVMSGKAIVSIVSGKIEGRFEEGLYVFRGIPYAAPPLGRLRWQPPAPVEPWTGTGTASSFAPIAPQIPPPPGVLDVLAALEPQAEDCLYLNIWSPGLDDKRRPVLFWIHGGAFTMGAGSQPLFDGHHLSTRGDVVVVSINYRLGMLGFLNLERATGGNIPATGNEGFLDQIAALQWVRDNIAGFGGDPGNVTVFGESAGGMSIGCLLAMPAAQGLFHKAILQSGVTVPPGDADPKTGEALLEALGIGPSNTDTLREVPPEKLLNVEMKLRIRAAGPGEPVRITVTAPGVDGKTLPRMPLDAAAQGLIPKIPLLIGTNLEEWKLFGFMDPHASKMDEAMMVDRLKFFLGSAYNPEIAEVYRIAKGRRGESDNPYELLSAIASDFMFRIPALQMVDSAQRHGAPVYNYLFTWRSPALAGVLGACHGLEIGFVFGTHDEVFCGRGAEADRLSKSMQDAWVAFARTGDPSCKAVGKWPRYGNRRATMMLGKKCTIQEGPNEEERQVWERLNVR
jgi:para-nitrobenzyl esterase